MAFDLGVAYVSIVPSARGIQGNIARELSPVSTAAALEGQRAGKALITGVTASNVAGAFEKEGQRAASSFERSTSRNLGRAFAKLGGLGTGFGVPFANELSAVGAKLDSTSIKGASFGKTISKIGGVELIAGAAGIALLGRSSVHAAQDFEVAQARLTQALSNQGTSFAAQREEVEKTNTAMRKLGFTDTDTEAALARLVGATHNTAKAQHDVAIAADLARAKNLDLASATQIVALVEAGRFRGLGQLGIKTSDLTGKTNAIQIAFARLDAVVGGQAQAHMGTFAGKLAAVHAEADKLEVTIGEALIPKIEALASGAVGAVQGFEKANRASDGFLGKAIAIGAAVPVGVFAIEKLGKAGAAIGGQFVKAGNAVGSAFGLIQSAGATAGTVITGVGTATELATIKAAQATVAQGALAAATSTSAEANAALDAAMAGLAIAEEGDVVAAAEVVAAHNAVTAALARQTAAALAAAAATGAADAASAATGAAAAAGAVTGVGEGAAITGAAAGLGLVAGAVAIPLAGLAFAIVQIRTQAAKDAEIKGLAADLLKTGTAARTAQTELSRIVTPDVGGGKTGRDLQTYADALVSAADKAKIAAAEAALHGDAEQQAAVKVLGAKQAAEANAAQLKILKDHSEAYTIALHDAEAGIDTAKEKLKQLTEQYGAGAIKSAELSAAQKQLRDDLTLVETGADAGGAAAKRLAGDRAAVASAGRIVAKVEGEVQAATDGTTGAVNTNAAAVKNAQFAYLGLGSSITTAQGVLEAFTNQAFKPIKLDIAATSAKSDLASALAALHETPDTGTSGGGSGQTATAKALEQQQKELAVRDARQGVIDATNGVTDAEKQLNQARQASVAAQATLTASEQNYRTVLQGVARDSQAARDATENLTKAKNDAEGSQLDVRSAKRRLAQAKNDRALLALAVQDARDQLKADQGIQDVNTFVPSATGSKAVAPQKASKSQIKKDQIALNDALIAQTGADDSVKQAELDLSNARLRAKDATKAQNEAQRTLNGTLHGYPPNSREAKAAQDQLTQAQRDARTAADAVTTAYLGVGAAQRQIATAALAAERANADLAGKLDSVGGAATSSGKKLDDFVTRLNNAKQKSIDAATAIAAQVPRVAQLPVLGVLSMIETLKSIVDKEPLLAASLGVAIGSLEQDLIKLQSKAGSAAQFLKLLPGSSIGGTTHRASGGEVGPGRMFIVGEHGPELLVSPPRGDIVPAASLRNSRPFAGGGDTIYLTVSTMDANRDAPFVVRALEAHSQKNGGLPPTIKTRN